MKILVAVLAAAIVSGAACTDADGPASPSEAPTISALSPTSGRVGTSMTLIGSGFARDGNTVKFGTGYIKDVSSPDGRTIGLNVPAGLEECPPPNIAVTVCPLLARVVTPGTYLVAIINRSASSNELPFTVQER